MAAPTFVASGLGASSWSTTTTPKTASVTTQVGDVLVVLASHGTPATVINTPTGGTSLSWTLQKSFTGAGAPSMYVWTATATTAETFTLSVGRAATTDAWSFRFYQFRGSGGVGASVITAAHTTGAPSQALTTTGANSAVMCLVGDFNESTVTTRTWRTINSITPTAANTLEKDAVLVSGTASWLSAYWNDAGATGSKTLGLTTQTGADYSMASIEILGASGSNFSQTPSDSVTTSESASKNVTLRKSDSVTSSESAAKNTSLSKSDTVTSSDASQTTVGKTLADSSTPSDATGLNVQKNAADSATASDSFTRTVGFVRNMGDSATPSEAAAKNVGLTKSDSATATDASTRKVVLNKSDTATITDSPAKSVSRTSADIASATDAISIYKMFGKTTDGASSANNATNDKKVVSRFTLSETADIKSLTARLWVTAANSTPWRGIIYSDVAGAIGTLLAVTDDGAITNTTEAALTLPFSGANMLTLSAGSYWIGFHYQLSGTAVNWSRDNTANQRSEANDTFSDGTASGYGTVSLFSGPIDVYIKYAPSTALSWSRTPADTATTSDSVVLKPVLNKSDTATVNEQAAKNVSLVKADSATITDNATVIRGLKLSLSDTATSTDSFSRTAAYYRVISDTANSSDVVVKNVKLFKSDTSTATDLAAKKVVKFFADSISIPDGPITGQILKLSFSEAITADDLADIIIRTPQIIPSIPEGLTGIDNAIYIGAADSINGLTTDYYVVLEQTDSKLALGGNDNNGILS